MGETTPYARSLLRTCALPLLLLAACVALTGAAFIRVLENAPANVNDEQAEVLFLPNETGAKVFSFGYRNALANVLWFNTISYFGKHFRGDQRYTWLGSMCKLVTRLNPGEKQIFEFCATMLAWEAEHPQAALDLLSDAVQAHPGYWRFYYLRGFTAMYFLKDDVQAERDFAAAAKLPDADPWMARLATRKMATNGEPEAAVEFLEEMLDHATDDNQRRALEARLKDAFHERNLSRLEQALLVFEKRTGRKPASLEELRDSGLVQSDFKDPWGGKYFLDPESGAVKSTSNRRRLRGNQK